MSYSYFQRNFMISISSCKNTQKLFTCYAHWICSLEIVCMQVPIDTGTYISVFVDCGVLYSVHAVTYLCH